MEDDHRNNDRHPLDQLLNAYAMEANDHHEDGNIMMDIPFAQLRNAFATFQTQEFRDLCRRLQSNDPSLVRLDSHALMQVAAPGVYGGIIGRALQGNTRVAHLTLDIDRLMSRGQRNQDGGGDDGNELEPLINFIQGGSTTTTGSAAPLESLRLEDSDFLLDHDNHHVVTAVLQAAAASRFLKQVDLVLCVEREHYWQAFCHLVVTTTSIQTLSVVIESPVEMRSLVRTVLRRNGSLHHFECDGMQHLNAAERRHVQAYFERNRQVPQLLSKSGLDDGSSVLEGSSDSDSSGRNDSNEQRNDTMSSAQGNKEADERASAVMPAFVPAILASILPVEQMAPNFVLMGLSFLRGDNIGYANSLTIGPTAKRVRSGDEEL